MPPRATVYREECDRIHCRGLPVEVCNFIAPQQISVKLSDGSRNLLEIDGHRAVADIENIMIQQLCVSLLPSLRSEIVLESTKTRHQQG